MTDAWKEVLTPNEREAVALMECFKVPDTTIVSCIRRLAQTVREQGEVVEAAKESHKDCIKCECKALKGQGCCGLGATIARLSQPNEGRTIAGCDDYYRWKLSPDMMAIIEKEIRRKVAMEIQR